MMRRPDCMLRLSATTIALLAMLSGTSLQAGNVSLQLHTIDHIIDEITVTSDLDVGDKLAVFDFVFGQLPTRVKVYPTENYYYFRFIHNGLQYAGNLRLDVLNRDAGKIEFSYFEELSPWTPDDRGMEQYAELDASYGVKVERKSRFSYDVTSKGKTVTFELNDLSDVRPPTNLVAKDERFIGPVFDESAIRFFLFLIRGLSSSYLFLMKPFPCPTLSLPFHVQIAS